jgi:hypothetical protein
MARRRPPIEALEEIVRIGGSGLTDWQRRRFAVGFFSDWGAERRRRGAMNRGKTVRYFVPIAAEGYGSQKGFVPSSLREDVGDPDRTPLFGSMSGMTVIRPEPRIPHLSSSMSGDDALTDLERVVRSEGCASLCWQVADISLRYPPFQHKSFLG